MATIYTYGNSAQELYVQDIIEATGGHYAGKLESLHGKTPQFVFPLGSTPEAKENVMAEMAAARVQPVSLIHPSACISRSAEIGPGVLITTLVSVAANTVIEAGAVIHSHCVIGHDNHIGMFASLSPGCVLAGTVRIGPRAKLGSNVTVCPNKSIGPGADVWAGSVIQKDAPPMKVHYNYEPDASPFRKGRKS